MRFLIALAFPFLFIGACSPTRVSPADAGINDVPLPSEDAGDAILDGGTVDAAPPGDAGFLDAGPSDVDITDAVSPDTGGDDAGNRDAGYARNDDAGGANDDDAGHVDAGMQDGGREDAGSNDAAQADAGENDAGHWEDAGLADAGLEDAGDLDSGVEDAGTTTTDAGMICPEGQTLCSDRCIATDFDPAHCGSCDAICEAGTGASAACLFGTCVSACPAGLTLCGNDCVDIRKSSTHCGECNVGCEAPAGGFTTCEAGRCVDSCLSTDALCDGVCTPVREDANRCGACANVCQVPSGGTVSCIDFNCVPACPEPDTLCGQECVNTSERSEHCGGCDVLCNADAHCAGGECVRNAPALVGVEPSLAHVHARSILTLQGERLAAPVQAWLQRDAFEIELTQVLATDENLYVRLPTGLQPGRYDVRVETPSGETVLADALDMIAAPLRIEVLRAGQGDAQVITAPNGTTMVIDGSIEPVGVQTLRPRFESPPDYVVVSHYDADHLGGIYALLAGPDLEPNTSDDLEPNIALLDHGDNHSCSSQLCANYLTLRDRLESLGKAKTLGAGDLFSLGTGVTATCVLVNGRIAERPRQLTSHENENSVGMYIEFLGFSYLTAGDVTGGPIPGCNAAIAGDFVDVETPIARLTGRLDLLKVAHHGSCTATPLTFSALAQPQVGIISMGQNNAFCHPADRVTKNLSHLGTDLYLTNPGVDDVNNASGCPLSNLPLHVAPLFADVMVQVPGDGTFSAHVGEYDTQSNNSATQGDSQTHDMDAGPSDASDSADGDASIQTPDGGAESHISTYSKTYSLLQTRPVFQRMDFDNGYSTNFEFLGDELAHPVGAPIRIRSSLTWLQDEAFLVPLHEMTAELVDALENGQGSPALVATTRSMNNDVLELIPGGPLAPHTQYVLLLSPNATGFEKSTWLHFTTSLLLPQGASYSLVPPPYADNGVLIDAAEIVLDFERAIFNPQSQGSDINLFLEEVESGAEVVTGTHQVSENGMRVTLTLPTTSRLGPNGETCQSLCPNMTYGVRALGTIVDSEGVSIDTDALHTFSTANCADASAPSMGRSEIRVFPNAASLSIYTDEPVEGELRLAPSALFPTVCAEPIGPDCIRVPLAQGACSGDPCAPVASSCHHFAVSEVLQDNVEYSWEVHAADRIGKPLIIPSASFSTAVPNATLVLNEVLVDSQQSPESLGEYIEVVNVSPNAVNLCEYRVGKALDASSLKPLCTDDEAWLGPSESALLTGNNFCAAKNATCTPEFDYPSTTQIYRQSTASLLGGLSNGSPPDLYLVDSNHQVVSRVLGAPSCEEGSAVVRLSVYGPDDPILFACSPASPGFLEE